jgi:O-antigen/teichoic acid export membrane protein
MRNAFHAMTLALANIATSLTHYVVIILIARHCGVAEFGNYTAILAYASLFMTLPNFGLDRILIREVAHTPVAAGQYLGNAALIRVVLGGVALLAAALIAVPAGFAQGQLILVVVFFLVLCLNSLSELCRSTCYAFGAMPLESVLRIFGRMITVAATAVAVFSGGKLLTIGLAMCLAGMLELLTYGTTVIRRFPSAHPSWNLEVARSLLRASLPLAINTVLVVVYFRINAVMLSRMKGAEATAWFGAAFTFVQVLQVVSAAVAGVMLPLLARQFAQNREQFAVSFNRAFYYMMILAFPVVAGTYLLAAQVVVLVYGTQYESAAAALRVVIWASVFMFSGCLASTALVAARRQRGLVWTAALAVIVSLVLNWVLIRQFSYTGASWATLLTEGFVAAATFALLPAFILRAVRWSQLWRPLVATILMAMAVRFAAPMAWPAQVLSGIVVYVLVLLAVRGVPADDLALARLVLERLRQSARR